MHPQIPSPDLEGIAIVGLAGRFPGAPDARRFWNNLANGVESISRFSVSELEVRDAARQARDPNYVTARAVLDGVDLFDAGFFGIYPQEAKLTDPQHRIFLECCWEALEDSGHDPARESSSVGVFAGCSQNSYFMTQVASGREYLQDYAAAYQVGFYPTMLGAMGDTLATRVAYKLNLTGPAVTLLSACSTALVAVCQACTSLLTWQCDMALAGAVSVSFPQKRGYLYQAGGMVSPDGHCRSFDADAQGTVFGSGAGVVLLKRLEEAVRDGDHIYAVIKGSAVNNDGAGKVGFTAPSVDGQAKVVAMAQAAAGVDPRSISYIEAHGTGTPLGDPIEIAALTQVFRETTDETHFCAIGTAKTNVGHLDVASGVTGLIKTALSLEHKQLPPMLHFERPNPKLNLETSPFFVDTELRDWTTPAGVPRRAGVSAFGVGGTNAHVVLEEAPAIEASESPRSYRLLPLSARSPEALANAVENLAEHLRRNPDADLADASFTLQVGRRAFDHRAAFVCRDTPEAVEALAGHRPGAGTAAKQPSPNVHFLFPGQGAQQVDMGRELYSSERQFRETVDRCAEILQPHLGEDLRNVIFADASDPMAQRRLSQTRFAQPAIFTIEYALAQLWMRWGVRPQATIGHSVGEFVSACLAEVFSLEDALSLIAERGRLMQNLPGGAMLSVRLPESRVSPLLDGNLSLAAVNGPSLSVVAGPFDGIAALESQLQRDGIAFRRLHTSHAFHSVMMDPIVEPFTDYVGRLRLAPPTTPYLSCVTGTWITEAQATDPAYWARHFRQPVRFSEAITELRNKAGDVLLEVGPGTTLQTLARQHPLPSGAKQAVVSSMPDASAAQSRSESKTVLQALGLLWTEGVEPDWSAFHEDERRRRVSLPTYPFERKRYWMEPSANSETETHKEESREEPPVATMTQSESNQAGRKLRFVAPLVTIIQDLSGMDEASIDPSASFLELGFDSLFLTQVTQSVQGQFGVKVTFRQLLDGLSSIHALSAFLDEQLPPAPPEPVPAPVPVATAPAVPAAPVSVPPTPPPPAPVPSNGIESLMQQQIQAMSQLISAQLEVLRAGGSNAVVSQPAVAIPSVEARPAVVSQPPAAPQPAPAAAVPEKEFKPFGPYKPIQRGAAADLTPTQQAYLHALIERYSQKTRGSKQLTQKYRRVLADPRVASGFRSQWKEIVYPIVTNRSHGSRLWDIDGNEYIDLLNGFGPIAFGHVPDFVADAVAHQLKQGIEIGPQTPLAGEVAELLCELTHMDRATFCNTGSEAVMAAMRLARTVTGRKKVVLFNGDYHGNFEEVLVKRVGRGESLRSGPIAPGIAPEAVENIIVLDYGAPEALAVIRQHASEIAAVLLEPVQSRHPELRPREFLFELREITAASGVALIFDEIVTGFRVHQGGAQAMYGIQADIATYGKVLGGGLPIGAIAGKAKFMDALDGGMWSYGDDSYPETGVTFFAGTFVRHPLAMAAARAVLQHLKDSGPALQERLTERTENFIAGLNRIFERYRVPSRVASCGSWFYFSFPADFRFGSLLYYHLREKGVHILEGFPCFLTTAHSDADLASIERAFDESCREMRAGGVLPAADPQSLPAPVKATGEVLEAPLTESQLEIWLSAQLSPEASCSYNESFTVSFQGDLNRAALTQALSELIARHDALRSRFDSEGNRFRIERAAPVELPLLDFAGRTDAKAALDQLIEHEARTPFDLADGPLVRLSLARLEPLRHVLLFTSHHIVCDGWSTNVILDELGASYTAACAGKPSDLPPALSFAQYATDQKNEGASATQRSAQEFWLNQFANLPPVLDLPVDRPRPPVKSFHGASLRRTIGEKLYRDLKSAGARQGCTLFATLLTGFQALLNRLTGQDDLVVGIPAAGQSLLEGQTLAGHCVNFLPLRARIPESGSFAELLGQSKRTLLDAYERQTVTYGTLVRKLGIVRDPSRLPLVEAQFNLEQVGKRIHFHELEVEIDSCPKQFVNFDLFLNIVESRNGLVLDCDFNTGLFDEETIARWLGHYETLLRSVAAEMTQPLAGVAVLEEAEQRQLLFERNRTDSEYPRHLCVHELIEQRALETPNAVAAVFEGESMTYAALNASAGKLASLLKRYGVGPNRLVAIYVERSAQMIVAMLGVWKAGGAYLPLDPAYPKERLDFILSDANPQAIVTEERLAIGLGGTNGRIICLDGDPGLVAREQPIGVPGGAGPEDLAYVIYTSGSTGKPKGVEIQHRAAVNFLCSMLQKPGFHAKDRLLAVTTLSFDIAGLEIFLPLIAGGRVVVAGKEATTDGMRLARLMEDSGITVMQATPSTWRLLLEAEWKPSRPVKMLCGGEALPRDLADELLQLPGELWNMYGPTETTIWSAVSLVNPGPAPVTVGPPIANTQFYVLDSRRQPVPLGVPGELFIGGDGLARGYFRRPELTGEKFVADPFRHAANARMYRTGDLVRALPNGHLEFLGRLDHQVKIRGFRVELGEIETVVCRHDLVAESVVAVLKDGGTERLVCYFTGANGAAPSSGELKAFVSKTLPPYMVPAFFVPLEKIPRTPNGKVDRKGLPALHPSLSAAPRPSAPPRNETEKTLVSICKEVLGLGEIGIEDSLFELGADSIQIFRIIARANRAGIGVTVQEVLRHPAIRDFSTPSPAAPAKQAARLRPILPVSREAYRSEPSQVISQWQPTKQA